MRLRSKLSGLPLFLLAYYAHATTMAALPREDAPAHHWPWWLRILAVIAVLAFVQIVARSMRKGAGRTGANPDQKG